MLRNLRPLPRLSFGRASLLSLLLSPLFASVPSPACAQFEEAKRVLADLGKSDAIVIGRATAIRQESVEGAPVSLVTFRVSEKVGGTAASEIEIVVPRVMIQPGKILVETGSQDQPVLGPGDEALLFVTRYPGRDGSYSITSGNLGKFSVMTQADGEKRAERYMLAGPVAGGVPLAALIGQIRKELKLPEEKPAPPAPPQ